MRKGFKVALVIFGVLFIFFTTYFATQTALINDVNRSTIISGVLSMIGGTAGALGAYLVAMYQMNKSRTYDEENRLIDLKVTKLDETIKIFNDLKLLINTTDGIVKDVNLTIKLYRDEKKFTHLNQEQISLAKIQNISETLVKIESLINKINTNKWYLKSKFDIDKLYVLRSNYGQDLKKYNAILHPIANNKPLDLNEGFNGLFTVSERAYDKRYNEFISFIEGVISTLEKEIEKILSIPKQSNKNSISS